jgi:hypothetical protein
MKQRRRIYYSAAQRSEIWDRWQAGEPMSSIGRRFDRESSSVFSVISPSGGIRPPDRHRAKQALSLSEREEISRWLSMRRSLRSIARHLGRSASTVSREPPRSTSTSVILAVPGSAGQTKTPTDCCASIFRVAQICPCIARPSSAQSQGCSMKDPERPCSIRPQLRSLQNVLQRSVEPAPKSGRPNTLRRRQLRAQKRTRSIPQRANNVRRPGGEPPGSIAAESP